MVDGHREVCIWRLWRNDSSVDIEPIASRIIHVCVRRISVRIEVTPPSDPVILADPHDGGSKRKSRLTDEQIIAILQESAAGGKTGELNRRHGISRETQTIRPDPVRETSTSEDAFAKLLFFRTQKKVDRRAGTPAVRFKALSKPVPGNLARENRKP